ncbi:MAG: DUF4340 domain-containing protein, partial [Oscillospiraceae bacterium]
MSKKVKAIIIGGAVLLLLGGLLVFLLKTQKKPADETSSTAPKPAISVISEDEQTLESAIVSNKGGEYEIKLVGEKKWGISELADLAYVDYKYTNFATTLSTLNASQIVTETADNLEEYGLAKPRATCKLKYKNGNTYEVILGNKTTDTANYYFMIKGETKVYVSDGYGIEVLTKNKYSYLDTLLYPSFDKQDSKTIPQIQKLTVTRPDLAKPIIFENTNKDSSVEMLQKVLNMTSPVNIAINTTVTEPYIYSLFGMSATEIVSAKATAKEKQDYGLDKPAATVEIKYDDTKVAKIIIGNGRDCQHEEGENLKDHTHTTASYYVMKEASDIIYVVDKTKMVWLDMDAEKVMSSIVLMPNVLDLDAIAVNANDKDYLFKLTHSKDDKDAAVLAVTCNGNTVSDTQFRTLLQIMYTTPVDKINTSPATGGAVMSITYKYNNGHADDKLVLYPL